MFDCLCCSGAFPREQVVYRESDNGPDYGPICIACFTTLHYEFDKMTGKANAEFARMYVETQEMKARISEDSRRVWRDRGQEPPV